MPRHPPFSLPFLVLVFSLFTSTSNFVNAVPISNLDWPSPEDIEAGAVSVQPLEGAGVNLPLRSVPFVRRRTELNDRSVLDQLNNPDRRYFPFHTTSPPSHPEAFLPHSVDTHMSALSEDAFADTVKRAYVNPMLDHLRESYKHGSADVLPWTEEQKEGHKFKLGAIIQGLGLGTGKEDGGSLEGLKPTSSVLKAAAVDGGNTTAIAGNLSAAAEVTFDAWPAGIKMIVHPKGNAASGYSSKSLSILRAQAQSPDDLDTVTHSSGALAAQSVDYSIFSVDTGYIADIEVGSAGKKYSMLIDTGSADTWIGNKDCPKCRVTLSLDDSSTFKLGTKNFNIQYGLGSAEMTSATDKFGIAGMSVDQFDFGSAHTVDDQFTNPSTPFAGILGTAQGVLTAQGVRTLPERLMDTGVIPNAVLAYALGRVADGENTGQLTVGGFDSAKQNGETTQILNVVDGSGFWKAQMGAVMVDGDVAISGNRVALLDTGTTLMYLPPADANAIHLLIEGAAPWVRDRSDVPPEDHIYDFFGAIFISDGQGGYTVPCTMTEVIYFQFGSVAFSIDPRDITWLPVDINQPKGRCLSSITGSPIDDRGTWLIGDPFLKNVYMVTDTGNNKIHLSGREGARTTNRGV